MNRDTWYSICRQDGDKIEKNDRIKRERVVMGQEKKSSQSSPICLVIRKTIESQHPPPLVTAMMPKGNISGDVSKGINVCTDEIVASKKKL